MLLVPVSDDHNQKSCQSSEAMPYKAAAKASGAINGACCVVVVCLLLDVLFFSTLAIGEEHPMANVPMANERNSSPITVGLERRKQKCQNVKLKT